MRAITAFAVWLVLVVGQASAAEEPTPGEARFLRDMVRALTDPSPDVRVAAEQALVSMRAKTAHYFVHDVKAVESEAHEAVIRVLVTIGAPTLEALAQAKRRPAGDYGALLRSAEVAIRGSRPLQEPTDPAVAAEVDAIIAGLPRDHFYSDDPAIDKLVRLGRPAIPALLAYLDPARGSSGGMHGLCAAAALERLCTKADTTRLGALLAEGWAKVAQVLQATDDSRAVPYLIAALERGLLTYEIGSALRHFRDVRSKAPIVDYLRKHGCELRWGFQHLLELCVDFQAREALPCILLMRHAAQAGETGGPWSQMGQLEKVTYCALALVRLGEPAGLPDLIAVLGAAAPSAAWLVQQAGATLDSVTGNRFWQEGGDVEAAQDRYRAWWAANGDRLKWDGVERKFLAVP